MVKVILLNKSLLGNIGNIINVSSGYARNYLIPYSKAIYASKENIKYFNNKIYLDNKYKEKEISKINELYKKIISLSPLLIKSKCSKKGKLFGSITSKKISKIISNKINFNIPEKFIILPNNSSLKYLNKYNINIFLYKKKKFNFLVEIVSS